MPTNVNSCLVYAQLQLAAESLFGLNPEAATPGQTSTVMTVETLTEGNGRSSRFTPSEAQRFVQEWRVVQHKSNTATGFSGTLFEYIGQSDPSRGLVPGQLVMSFRSTEFVDDAARDTQATNALEIKEFGWAFGQIADMRVWIESLRAESRIPAGQAITVTGYSLGGHLAAAYSHLLDDAGTTGRVAATYTFNGAGVGMTTNGVSLTATMDAFQANRHPDADLSSRFTNATVRSVYQSFRGTLRGGAVLSNSDLASAFATLAPLSQNVPEAALLLSALDRIRVIQQEMSRISTPGPLQSGAFGSDPLQTVGAASVEATNINYQVAVLLAARNTSAPGIASTTWQAFTTRVQGSLQFDNFFDVYGSTVPSAVANSMYHYGDAVPVFIEDQPLHRGSIVWDVATQTAQYFDAKLLVNNFAVNDFGDSHSLVLLVDSLSVQDALARLDPNVSATTLNGILQSASQAKANSVYGAQGSAEGDVLENVLDALRRMLIDPAAASTPGSLVGGTWADPNARATFHQRLEQVLDSPAFTSLKGRVTVSLSDASMLKSAAKQDFAAFLALQGLSPVALRPNAGQSDAVQSALAGGGNAAMFAAWSADRALSPAQRAAGLGTFSDAYYSDRSDVLAAVLQRNQRNDQGPLFSAAQVGLTVQEQTVFTDTASQTQLVVGGSSMPPDPSIRKQIWFGSDLSESFTGSSRNDRLYGGGNNDTLAGADGADWLEGQTGDDSLLGGAGIDTLRGGRGDDILVGGEDADALYGGAGNDVYRFSGNWRTDTIRDGDGQDRIEVEGLNQLTGSGAKVVAPNVWETDDKRVRYAYVGANGGQQGYLLISVGGATHYGHIRIEGWSTGQFGINLGNVAAEAPTAELYVGDFAKTTNTEGTQYSVGGGVDFRRYTGGGVQADAPDVLNGTGGADSLRGLGGNDGLAGGNGDDTLEGGAGNDVLLGGTGTDSLLGGDGDDVIFGSALGSVATPAVVGEELPDLPVGTVERTRGFSWMSYRSPGQRLAGSDATMLYTDVVGAGTYMTWLEGETTYYDSSGDIIDGGAGNDYIAAGTGADLVHGGADDDDIVGLDDADILFGDDGNDFIWGDGANANSDPGSPASNANVAGEYHGDDVIDGGTGNDVLVGQGGSDALFGGGDDDWLIGDDVESELRGEFHGNDFLDGGSGNDQLTGGGRNDSLVGGVGNDSLWGDDSNEHLDEAIHGRDLLDGGQGADQLVGGGDDDTVVGGDGDDRLLGDDVQSRVDVTAHGDDELDGGLGSDQMVGGGGDDILAGGDGDDQLQGDDLVDNVAASAHGEDTLDGGAGNDRLYGNGGNDSLVGGEGNDWLAGEDQETVDASSTLQGADTLVGGGGLDTLVGGTGNDVLEGGAGRDFLAGGAGSDLYVLAPTEI